MNFTGWTVLFPHSFWGVAVIPSYRSPQFWVTMDMSRVWCFWGHFGSRSLWPLHDTSWSLCTWPCQCVETWIKNKMTGWSFKWKKTIPVDEGSRISKGFMLNFWVESLCWLLPLRVRSNYCSVKLHCCPENEGRKYNPLRFEEQHNWGTRMDGRWWFSNSRSNFNRDILNLQYTMAPSLFPWTWHPKRIF